MSVHVGTACLDSCFSDPGTLIRAAAGQLRGIEFDTMAGSGMSGSLIIPLLARAMSKNFLIVRKAGDSHHHGMSIAEGDLGDRWIFVDDGIETGATLTRVKNAVALLARSYRIPAQFQGAYLYGHSDIGDRAHFMTPDELRQLEIAQ